MEKTKRKMDPKRVIRIGTRKSQLAMIQAEHVQGKLKSMFPDMSFDIVAMSTTGDQILDKALNKIGEKSLFTKELEIALEQGKVDLIVHSLKDLPSTLPPNMAIGAIMEREDPRDVLVLRKELHLSKVSLKDLREGAIIGTSAVRRAAQLRAKYPKFSYRNIRGNLNTRLRKVDNQEGEDYAAMILAAAGVLRMGWEDRISEYIDIECCMHAVGQGALGIECLQDDVQVLSIINRLNHVPTLLACVAERALMRKLEGGCSAPVAAHGEVEGSELSLRAGVWSLDGTKDLVMTHKKAIESQASSTHPIEWNTQRLFSSVSHSTDLHQQLQSAENCGMELGELMLQNGAGKILEAAKLETHAK